MQAVLGGCVVGRPNVKNKLNYHFLWFINYLDEI